MYSVSMYSKIHQSPLNAYAFHAAASPTLIPVAMQLGNLEVILVHRGRSSAILSYNSEPVLPALYLQHAALLIERLVHVKRIP
jgi:hypothetical protein